MRTPSIFKQAPAQALTKTVRVTEKCILPAGVYYNDPTVGWVMVRLLHGPDHIVEAGSVVLRWNGKDDKGNICPPRAYRIFYHVVPVGKGKVEAIWNGEKEGLIGTTMPGWQDSVYVGTEFYASLAVGKAYAYRGTGYTENQCGQLAIPKTNIQSKIPVFSIGECSVEVHDSSIVLDNEKAYWLGYTSYGTDANPLRSRLILNATYIANNAEHIAANGIAYRNENHQYSSVLPIGQLTAYGNGFNRHKGMGVQKEGNLLVIGSTDGIYVLDKHTYAIKYLDGSLLVDNLIVDRKDQLWIVEGNTVTHCIYDETSIVRTAEVITNDSPIIRIAHKHLVNEIGILDAGRQVKIYDCATSVLKATFGKKDHFLTDMRVGDDTFSFLHEQQYSGAIAFDPENDNCWIADGGLKALRIYDKEWKVIDRHSYITVSYCLAGNMTDSSLLFNGFNLIKIDDTLPAGKSWQLIRNYEEVAPWTSDNYYKVVSYTTLPNGKEIGIIATAQYNRRVVEFADNGMHTIYDIPIAHENGSGYLPGLAPNGNLRGLIHNQVGVGDPNEDNAGKHQDITVQVLDLATMTYGPKTIEASTPPICASSSRITPNNLNLNAYSPETGEWIVFNGADSDARASHFGIFKVGTDGVSKWVAEMALATKNNAKCPYPRDDSFDISATGSGGSQYRGSRGSIDKGWKHRNSHDEYYGGAWLQGHPTNMHWLYSPINLPVMQWGVDNMYTVIPGQAGNAICTHFHVRNMPDGSQVAIVKHNDEGRFGGIHKWTVTNINAIETHYVDVTLPLLSGVSVEVFDGDLDSVYKVDIYKEMAMPTSLAGYGLHNAVASMRVSGFIKASNTKVTTFSIATKGKAALTVNKQTIFDDWATTANARTLSGTIALEAGKWYPFVFNYSLNAVDAINLVWDNLTPATAIPATSLQMNLNVTTDLDEVNLLEGLKYSGYLQHGRNGYTTSPNTLTEATPIYTGLNSWDEEKDSDIYPIPTAGCSWTRNLAGKQLGDWQIVVNRQAYFDHPNSEIGLVDKAGKKILQINFPNFDYILDGVHYGRRLVINGKVQKYVGIFQMRLQYQRFYLTKIGTKLFFAIEGALNNIQITPVDADANISELGYWYENLADSRNEPVGIQSFKLIATGVQDYPEIAQQDENAITTDITAPLRLVNAESAVDTFCGPYTGETVAQAIIAANKNIPQALRSSRLIRLIVAPGTDAEKRLFAHYRDGDEDNHLIPVVESELPEQYFQRLNGDTIGVNNKVAFGKPNADFQIDSSGLINSDAGYFGSYSGAGFAFKGVGNDPTTIASYSGMQIMPLTEKPPYAVDYNPVGISRDAQHLAIAFAKGGTTGVNLIAANNQAAYLLAFTSFASRTTAQGDLGGIGPNGELFLKSKIHFTNGKQGVGKQLVSDANGYVDYEDSHKIVADIVARDAVQPNSQVQTIIVISDTSKPDIDLQKPGAYTTYLLLPDGKRIYVPSRADNF